MTVLYQDLFSDRMTLLLRYTFQVWISCKKRLENKYILYRKPRGGDRRWKDTVFREILTLSCEKCANHINTGSAKKIYTHFNERKLYVV
jgi:hypothetical protein